MIPKQLPAGDWLERAACRGKDMELSTYTKKQAWYERRRTDWNRILLCSTCPVLDECTNWVMGEELDPCPCHIVAGMVPVERGRIRREARKARRG